MGHFISKEIQFDAGHRVPKHGSKCRNPHGHRYKIIVHCEGQIVTEEGSPDQGMLIDFGDLKTFMMTEIHDVLDHGFIAFTGDTTMLEALECSGSGEAWKVIVFPYIPTAENLARWCWEKLEPLINSHWRNNITLHRVDVWETPTSVATYSSEEVDPLNWERRRDAETI